MKEKRTEKEQMIMAQIKSNREARGMSQMELSLALGYKTNMINKIENGKVAVMIGMLDKMNKHFGWEFEL